MSNRRPNLQLGESISESVLHSKHMHPKRQTFKNLVISVMKPQFSTQTNLIFNPNTGGRFFRQCLMLLFDSCSAKASDESDLRLHHRVGRTMILYRSLKLELVSLGSSLRSNARRTK